MNELTTKRDQIHEWMQFQKWEEVDEAWWGLFDSLPLPAEFHEPLIGRLVRRKFFDKLRELYGLMFEAMFEQGHAREVVAIVDMILALKPPMEEMDFLREPVRKALLRVHSDRPAAEIESFFKLAGLYDSEQRINRALAQFNAFIAVSPGRVFRHSRWGLGKVVSLDAPGGKVTLDFAQKAGQTFTIEGAMEFLQAIPPDHFVTAMVRDPAALRARLDAEPAETVKFALRSQGDALLVSDLKKIVLEGMMDEAAWKSWWGRARDAVRLDPWIDLSGSTARPEIRLRKAPRAFSDEILERTQAAADVEAWRDLLRDIRRHPAEESLTADQTHAVADRLRAALRAYPPDAVAERLALGYTWEEYRDVLREDLAAADFDEAALIQAGLARGEGAQFVLAIPAHELQTRACEGTRSHAAHRWPVIMGELLCDSSPRLAGWIEKALDNAGESAVRLQALENILAEPARNPELFLWVLRGVFDGKFPHVADGMPKSILVLDLLSLLNEEHAVMEGGGADGELARATTTKLRGFINDSNNKYIRQVGRESTTEEARKVLAAIHLNNDLPDSTKHSCEALLIQAHPDLRRPSRAEAEEETRRASYHYTLQTTLDSQRQRLSQILNVEIPANSKAIGVARELGDLRENAEYHAAKERQKLLHQQAQELGDAINRARVVEPATIKTEAVGFGTRFEARDLDANQTAYYTILGMWEADPEHGVLSYMTPFGGAFLGARVGQTIEVATLDGHTHRYEILSIAKAVGE